VKFQGGIIMVVQHNLTAMNTNRQLGIVSGAQQKSTEKLSSGYRINRAADDAAGLAISEKMRRQIRGLTQASTNAQDGISCVQTAEGALAEVHDMLQRMNELAVQAANGTQTSADRGYINSEIQALVSEIDRVASTTTFNEQKLLNGEFSQGKGLQVGAEAYQLITIKIGSLSAEGIGLTGNQTVKMKDGSAAGDISVGGTDATKAQAAISIIKLALAKVSKQRSDLGAVQNRLEHTIKNLDNVVENTTAAESQIRDTDMASEMVKFSNNNILAQAGQAMLAQANQTNQGVLSILG
jgi:flagellin